MNKQDFLNDSNKVLNEALRVLTAKATYSTDDDALHAFKVEAEVARLLGLDSRKPTHRCLNEIVKKVERLVRMENQGWPKGIDSAEDSTLDIINYALLHRGLVKENTSNGQ